MFSTIVQGSKSKKHVDNKLQRERPTQRLQQLLHVCVTTAVSYCLLNTSFICKCRIFDVFTRSAPSTCPSCNARAGRKQIAQVRDALLLQFSLFDSYVTTMASFVAGHVKFIYFRGDWCIAVLCACSAYPHRLLPDDLGNAKHCQLNRI